MPPTDVNQALKHWISGKRGGDQVRCEWRSEVFVKIQKKNQKGGGGGEGVMVDVNAEVKILRKFKKKLGVGGGGVGSGG